MTPTRSLSYHLLVLSAFALATSTHLGCNAIPIILPMDSDGGTQKVFADGPSIYQHPDTSGAMGCDASNPEDAKMSSWKDGKDGADAALLPHMELGTIKDLGIVQLVDSGVQKDASHPKDASHEGKNEGGLVSDYKLSGESLPADLFSISDTAAQKH